MHRIAPPLLAVLLVACGSDKTGVAPGPDAPNTAAPKSDVEPAPPTSTPGRYEASGTVLDKQGVGPQLCLGAVATSLPPQCGGIPLDGWDWAKVEGEQTAGDTTWGEYRVVGSYDGKRMTASEPPGPPQYPQDSFTFDPACPEPAGGWPRPDPKKSGQADLDRANQAAQKMPGYAGLWLYDLKPGQGEQQDPKNLVLNVTFTGELAAREAELRKLWGGALCVAQQKHSEVELARLRAQAEANIRELGMEMLDSSTDVVRGTIRVTVTTATAEQLAKLKERFGDTLVVSARMRPLP